jgi:TPP-dependent pyruvate/acetoin dehydrogenase alpha subunit
MSENTLTRGKSLVPTTSKFKIRSTSIKNFSKDELLDVYRKMHVSRRLDDKMLILLKQGKGFFHFIKFFDLKVWCVAGG